MHRISPGTAVGIFRAAMVGPTAEGVIVAVFARSAVIACWKRLVVKSGWGCAFTPLMERVTVNWLKVIFFLVSRVNCQGHGRGRSTDGYPINIHGDVFFYWE